MNVKDTVYTISEVYDISPNDVMTLDEKELEFFYEESLNYLDEASDESKIKRYEKDLNRMKRLSLKIARLSVNAGTPEVEEITDKIEKMIKDFEIILNKAKETNSFSEIEFEAKKQKVKIKRMLKTTSGYVKSHRGEIRKPLVWFLFFQLLGVAIHFGVLGIRRKKFFKEVTKIRMENNTKDRIKMENLITLATKSLVPVSAQQAIKEDIKKYIK